jgi:hypothetical protein
MKTTVMTVALALAGLTLMSAQTPSSAPAPNTNKPAATAAAKTKKHHKKAAKKAVKTPAAPAAAAK